MKCVPVGWLADQVGSMILCSRDNDFIGRSQMFHVVATATEIMRILLFVKDLGRKTDVDEG